MKERDWKREQQRLLRHMAEAARRHGRLNWLKRHIPTRETIHDYRLLRPFAPHLGQPALWRMTRRSVPRGVALGLFVGVIIPFMHTLHRGTVRNSDCVPMSPSLRSAPLSSIRSRSRRCIMRPIASARGNFTMMRPLVDPAAAERFSSELSRLLFWIHHASGPIALGILTIAVAAAVIGYFASRVIWRAWLGSKFRQRRTARREGL